MTPIMGSIAGNGSAGSGAKDTWQTGVWLIIACIVPRSYVPARSQKAASSWWTCSASPLSFILFTELRADLGYVSVLPIVDELCGCWRFVKIGDGMMYNCHNLKYVIVHLYQRALKTTGHRMVGL